MRGGGCCNRDVGVGNGGRSSASVVIEYYSCLFLHVKYFPILWEVMH